MVVVTTLNFNPFCCTMVWSFDSGNTKIESSIQDINNQLSITENLKLYELSELWKLSRPLRSVPGAVPFLESLSFNQTYGP